MWTLDKANAIFLALLLNYPVQNQSDAKANLLNLKKSDICGAELTRLRSEDSSMLEYLFSDIFSDVLLSLWMASSFGTSVKYLLNKPSCTHNRKAHYEYIKKRVCLSSDALWEAL